MKVSFKLNGEMVETEADAGLTLLDLLRRNFRLTAVKEGCGRGECGACTVMLNGKPVNSCLKLAATLSETDHVETVEGLSKDKVMQTIQKAYVDEGAVQCGFCIPGMSVSSYALLKNNKTPTKDDIKKALSGNICRCTGYKKIEQAVKTAAERLK